MLQELIDETYEEDGIVVMLQEQVPINGIPSNCQSTGFLQGLKQRYG